MPFIFAFLLLKLGLVFHLSELLVELSLEVALNVFLQLNGDRLVRMSAMVVLHVVFVHFFSDLHLHGVITWGNGEHVPPDLVELGMALEIMEAGEVYKDHEDSEAGNL